MHSILHNSTPARYYGSNPEGCDTPCQYSSDTIPYAMYEAQTQSSKLGYG